MSVRLIPCEFYFGMPKEAPKLPQGFELLAAPGQWLRAKGPDGRLWYVGTNRLIAIMERLPIGRTKMQQIANTNDTIPL